MIPDIETYSDDDAFNAVFLQLPPAPARVWLGCVGKMPHGKCDNQPIGEDLCYMHSIAAFIARQASTEPQ